MQPESEKKSFFRRHGMTFFAWSLVAAVAGFSIYVYFHSPFEGRVTFCLFHSLTGLDCPGCGMTHAVVALLRLDIRTAFACNALFPVYGAYCGWLTVSTARQYIRTGKATLPARPVAVHIILLVLALGYGVLRNTL